MKRANLNFFPHETPQVQPGATGTCRCRAPIPHAALSDRAGAEDRGVSAISGSIGLLRDLGYLRCEQIHPVVLWADLITLAECNLPAARLYEGHVNALRLVHTLADATLQNDVRQDVEAGSLLGVWGAEASVGLSVDGQKLSGGKRFASGLGTVAKAVVTVEQAGGVRLALLDVSDTSRHRPETWKKTGMRATMSGDFDATGMPSAALRWIGTEGQYLQEPGFIGGVWRIAAVQIGGTLGLIRAAADHLGGIGRLSAESQVARLGPMLTRALAAAEFVRLAAECAEGPAGLREPERAASLSAQARLLTEEIGQDAIAAVERSVGLHHFDEDAPTGRIARDLATYLRQAARDQLLQRSGSWALGKPGPYSRLLRGDDLDARS